MENLFQNGYKMAHDAQKFWENGMTQAFEEMTKSQVFLNLMSKSMESALNSRKIFDNVLSQWSDLFQIPNKKDADDINRQIFDINFRLEKMVSILSDIRDQGKAPIKSVETANDEIKKN